MNYGFFGSRFKSSRRPLSLVPKCGACGLLKTCNSPKMAVHGEGRRGILLVGEAPGRNEDEQGRPFVGKAGKRLRKELRKVGIDMDRDCWATNALICHPPANIIKDKNAVDYCRPNLINTLKKLQPNVTILLGGKAIESLIGYLWKDRIGEVARWVGWQIPSQKFNTWICPTWHPSHVEREEGEERSQTAEILARYFAWHLKKACKIRERPWETVPDYQARVRIVLNADAVDREIQLFMEEGRPVAVDYETDRLKPDHPEAKIVTCAVSNGKRTVAYPWGVRTALATRSLLLSELPKIGSNCKFEDRWTFKFFGIRVNNWRWDTMLGSHVLDNREDICSLKFQAFVVLGQESYDDHLRPFLKNAESGNAPNRIKDVTREQLLLYNGMDALLEYTLAKIQVPEIRRLSCQP